MKGKGKNDWEADKLIATARSLQPDIIIDNRTDIEQDPVSYTHLDVYKRQLYEDTIIIYSADHGDCMGAHRLIEKGAFTFDEIYRIPLVVKGLGTKDNESLVLLQELMPSILELAGMRPPKKVDGESLVPLMLGEVPDNGRKYIYGEYHYHFYTARQRMVRNLEYQFTFNENERGELYDLGKDPCCLLYTSAAPGNAWRRTAHRPALRTG